MKHKKEIIRLHKEGKSYREIQQILGCSKGTIAYHVGEGQKEKTRDRTNRNRTILKRKLWDIKEKNGCEDCKEKYPHWMLDFDHKPGFKKIDSPTQMLQKYSWEKALQELNKCDIVCANCHRIRTYQRNQSGYKNLDSGA
jgi:transposase